MQGNCFVGDPFPMQAKRDSNSRCRTVSICTKGLILPGIWNANPSTIATKTLILCIYLSPIVDESVVEALFHSGSSISSGALPYSASRIAAVDPTFWLAADWK